MIDGRTQSNVPLLAYVAWRFCRGGRKSGEAAKFACKAGENERQVAPAPISSRFLYVRPPLLLGAPNQNRHATQAMPLPNHYLFDFYV